MWQEVPTLWLGALWTVFKRSAVFKQRRLKRCALSVDNVAVLVAVLVDERLVILRHSAERHTHVREAAVVEEGLHTRRQKRCLRATCGQRSRRDRRSP